MVDLSQLYLKDPFGFSNTKAKVEFVRKRHLQKIRGCFHLQLTWLVWTLRYACPTHTSKELAHWYFYKLRPTFWTQLHLHYPNWKCILKTGSLWGDVNPSPMNFQRRVKDMIRDATLGNPWENKSKPSRKIMLAGPHLTTKWNYPCILQDYC